MTDPSTPLFELGVIADVQYADLEDGHVEGRCQRYREAPGKLIAALNDLRLRSPQIVLHLGDIVNGGLTSEATQKEFDLIAGIFEQHLVPAIPAVHVLGNHCLAAGRSTLLNRLNIPDCGYYTRELPHKWRLIILDTTEISGQAGFSEGSWQWQEAREYEAAHPLSDKEPQMSSWNGGISKQQLAWFKTELESAAEAGVRAIVACHHQIGEGGARATHMAWNWKEIEAVCLESKAFRLALAGHDHVGGYSMSKSVTGKQHFITLQGLLEAPPGGNAYGMLRVFEDRIELAGVGTVPCREMAV